MRHFPDLPVLRDVLEASGECIPQTLRDVGLVCCQHLLSTTGSLIESLCDCGLDPSRVFLLGKVYSSNSEVVQKLQTMGCTVISGSHAPAYGTHSQSLRGDARQLWKMAAERLGGAISKVVIVDDGGMMHLEMPMELQSTRRVAGVEQTTFGIGHYAAIETRGIPVINVASAAAKRHYETPLVCEALIRRVRQHLIAGKVKCPCGVIGLGKVGLQLAKALGDIGHAVFGFDKNSQRLEMLPKSRQCSCASEVVERAQFVFGCVGDDALRMNDVLLMGGGTRVFASCSTGDIEFRSLLLADFRWTPVGESTGPCPTLEAVYPSNLRLRILRSGYPVNFDNSPESVPARDIQLTRALLLAAVLQACQLLNQRKFEKPPGSLMLDPIMQRRIVESWRRHSGRGTSAVPDVDWFTRESRGNWIELE